jgi:hypothetical protein
MTSGAQFPRAKQLRKAKIELLGLELEGRLLDLGKHYQPSFSTFMSRAELVELLALVAWTLTAHAELVAARRGK